MEDHTLYSKKKKLKFNEEINLNISKYLILKKENIKII